jgi:hypothetical protein
LALVFSKSEQQSFVELTQTFSGVQREIDDLSAAYKLHFGDFIIFEHGTAPGLGRGCGVTRAHLHLVPKSVASLTDLIVAIEQEIGPMRIASLDLIPKNAEYIFVSDNPSKLNVWEGKHFPSQLVRRHIAAQLGSARWDWRELFGWDNFRQTLELWNGQGAPHARH